MYTYVLMLDKVNLFSPGRILYTLLLSPTSLIQHSFLESALLNSTPLGFCLVDVEKSIGLRLLELEKECWFKIARLGKERWIKIAGLGKKERWIKTAGLTKKGIGLRLLDLEGECWIKIAGLQKEYCNKFVGLRKRVYKYVMVLKGLFTVCLCTSTLLV